jgi:Na+-transporting NADH:ubiquinone oxidoreductase subunit NqrB
MGIEMLKRTAPYVAVLAVAAVLFILAGQISYVGKAGQIGPDLWPKAVLVLAMAASVYQIVCIALKCWREQAAFRESVATAEKSYTLRLLLGMGITLAYVALLSVIGFIFCTLLYLAAFMYIGRYRRHRVIVLSSVIGTLAFLLIFMRFVYVSLPMGREPFSTWSYALLALLGVR